MRSGGGAVQPSVEGGLRASGGCWEGEEGGFGGLYAEVTDDFERDCSGSETLGGYDFGGGWGLTFNTAAYGHGRFLENKSSTIAFLLVRQHLLAVIPAPDGLAALAGYSCSNNQPSSVGMYVRSATHV